MISTAMIAALVAATPISLEQAREEGRKNTQALLQALEQARAEARVVQGRSALLPQAAVTAGASRAMVGTSRQFATVPQLDQDGNVTGVVIEPRDIPGVNQNSFSVGVGLNQLLFDAGRWAQLAQLTSQSEAATSEAQEQQSASELEAIRRFYELYRAQATFEVLGKTVQRSEQQVERANALYGAGRTGKGELLAAQVNLGNDQIRVAQQKRAIAAARADLTVWLARPGAEELVAQEPGTIGATPAAAPALESALEAARSNRPLLRTLVSRLQAAEHGLSVARSDYLPTVSGFAQYRRGGPSVDPVFTDFTRNNSLQFGLDLRWDVFNGGLTVGQVSEATHARSQARLNLEQTQRELEAEVARSLRALEAQLEASTVAAKNQELAVQSLELSEERFKAGAGSTLEVRDAQLKLTQAELLLLESRIDVEVSRAALQRAMGQLGPGVVP